MNTSTSIIQFLYRIRFWIIVPPLVIAGLVAFFTSRLPSNYEASSTLYTGIASSPNLDGSVVASFFTTNSSFDNIINLAHSRSTLEAVSLKLFAQAMIKGDANRDNKYILSDNYTKLLEIVPNDVKLLVDTSSLEKTVERFAKYKKEGRNNFIYGLLNWFHPHYSIDALKKVKVYRLGTSDMIELKYTCNDPGIVHQTLLFLIEEIDKEYSQLQLGSSNDVIAYFEKQLVDTRQQLNQLEDTLLQYSMVSKVINYEEQTKRLTEIKRDMDVQYDNAFTNNYTSSYMVKQLEKQMTERAQLLQESKDFMQQMELASQLSQSIAELETSSNPSQQSKAKLSKLNDQLRNTRAKLQDISGTITTIKTTKEGLALQDIVNQWLTEKLTKDRTKAELEVLKRRQDEVNKEFARYTPIGPNLKKQEREILVTENEYQTILAHLAQARLQQKNIEMRSTTINLVSEPIYPLAAVGSKRKIIILVSLFASVLFIIGCFLVVELLDKTLRDKHRAAYMTKALVIGAFPDTPKHKYRGFALEANRMATSHLCNQLARLIDAKETTVIGLVSSEPLEGKSRIAAEMKAYWEDQGLSVQHLSHNSDFNSQSREYLKASGFSDIQTPSTPTHDILLVEFPALTVNAIPKSLFMSLHAVLYVVKANRAWKERDKSFYSALIGQLGMIPAFLFLNRASRLAVEEFTGLLPPHTKMRKWLYKLLQLELTSDKSSNIEKKK